MEFVRYRSNAHLNGLNVAIYKYGRSGKMCEQVENVRSGKKVSRRGYNRRDIRPEEAEETLTLTGLQRVIDELRSDRSPLD